MIRLAVVGSQSFNDPVFAYHWLDNLRWLFGALQVVSGGASGADTIGQHWAEQRTSIAPLIHYAKWSDLSAPGAIVRRRRDGKEYNARAGMDRNPLIVRDAQAALAFWDGRSPGTANTIKLVRAAKKPLLIAWPGRPEIWEGDWFALVEKNP